MSLFYRIILVLFFLTAAALIIFYFWRANLILVELSRPAREMGRKIKEFESSYGKINLGYLPYGVKMEDRPHLIETSSVERSEIIAGITYDYTCPFRPEMGEGVGSGLHISKTLIAYAPKRSLAEDQLLKEVNISGRRGLLITDPFGAASLDWEDDKFFFSIYKHLICDLTDQDLIRIAESIY